MKYLVLLLLFVGCSDTKITMDGIVKVPKYKIGDCLESCTEPDTSEHEFLERRKGNGVCVYRKIINVGKRNYLYTFHKGQLTGEFLIRIMDKYDRKVHNTYCEEN